MKVAASRGQADGACCHRVQNQIFHEGNIFFGRRLVINSAVAHCENAQRVVGHHGGNVYGARFGVERVQIFGETLPLPI